MKTGIIKLLLTLFFSFTLIVNCISQCSEYDIVNLRKTAIVFGEKSYKYAGPLSNPLNDASDISDSLKKEGFNVITFNDADLSTMTTAIDDWCKNLSKYDVALFYYSGHGAEVNGINYLFPIDANPQGPSDLYYTAYSANKILDRMEANNSKYNIMILDACRNNPFTKKWLREFNTNGLATMSGKGSFIGFAASPGTTASDGSRRNGLYTEGILKYITTTDLTIDQIFTKVNAYVREQSGDKQVTWKNSSLSSDFCFNVKHINNLQTIKESKFIQPSSKIVCTKDNQLFIINDKENILVKRDAESISTETITLSNNTKPYKLICADNKIFFLDTASKSFNIYDKKTSTISLNLPLKFNPTSLTISQDFRTAYVSIFQGKSHGEIIAIDIQTNKIFKNITFNEVPNNLVISNDYKYLYAAFNDSIHSLRTIDTKTGKTLKSFPFKVGLSEIAISPDSKLLFVLSSEGQIYVVNTNGFKIVDTLNFDGNLIAFSLDNKYAFINGKSQIAVVDIDSKEIINEFPFTTDPQGIAISNDNRAFIWLPQENRTFVIEINNKLKKEFVDDPENNLKLFKEEMKKNASLMALDKTKEIFTQTKNNYFNAVYTLTQELGNSFEMNTTFNGDDFSNLMSSYKCEIRSVFDHNKLINPYYILKLTDQYYILSIKQGEEQEEVFKSSVNAINWEAMKKFVRNYFLKRINQLK